VRGGYSVRELARNGVISEAVCERSDYDHRSVMITKKVKITDRWFLTCLVIITER